MSARDIELALRKQRLCLRSAELRQTLVHRCAEAAAPVQRARQRWEQLRSLLGLFKGWSQDHPQATRVAGGLAAGGLLAGAFRHRRSLTRLAVRAVSAWQLWRRVSLWVRQRV